MSMKKNLRHVLLWIYDKNNQIKGDDAVEEIREVYGHDSIGRMTVFRWLKKFRNGDKNVDDLEDDPRSGRPSKFNEKYTIAFDELQKFLKELQKNKTVVELPIYDFVHNARNPDKSRLIDGVDVILVEGVLIYCEKQIRDLCNLKLFLDVDPDIRLARRIKRDTVERGRSCESILNQYIMHVKPSHDKFCEPTKSYADLIIPRGVENDVATRLVVQHILQNIQENLLVELENENSA